MNNSGKSALEQNLLVASSPRNNSYSSLNANILGLFNGSNRASNLPPAPAVEPIGGGNGLKGEYYDNRDFTNLKVTRIDPTANFNWGFNSPAAGIAADTFSVRWTGLVQARFSETYTFSTTTDDGVRLWVDNRLIIDRFVNQAAKEWSGQINLEAGKKYNIRLEFYENTGHAVSQLRWSSASQAKEIIPQSQLFSEFVPTATLNATNVTTTGGASHTFTVTYADDIGIDVSSLDGNDIQVTDTNGVSQLASFVSVNTPSNGTPRIATYRINAPGGSWDSADNGSYTVALRANQVSDTSGNFAIASNLGTFSVNAGTTGGTGSGTGLKGEYFDNIDFKNLKLTRIDPTVNFDWVFGSPDPSIGSDTFSVLWTGQVEAKYNELYTFHTTTDDGVRLWVDNKLIVDRFFDQAATEGSGSIQLEAGKKYDIRLEYYDNAYHAVSQLAWSSASQTKEIIPQSQLYQPSATNAVPILTLEPSNITSFSETDSNATVTVQRIGSDLSGISTIKYATGSTSDTATPGQDYTATAGTITFAPGETSKTINIPILDDTLREGNESFTFIIDQPEGANLGNQRTLTITITDNELSNLTFSSPTVNEKDGTATVTVQRSSAVGTARVDFTTVNDTAIAGSDFRATSGTLNFADGEGSKTISIAIIDDASAEANEKFLLRFSNAVGVALSQTTTEININDDDLGSFVRESVVSRLNQPTAFDWTPDGSKMFIAEKSGVVKILENGNLLSTPFIDISRQVNNVRDRGLISIAVHPDFERNPYIYLAFTYDPEEVYNPENVNNSNTLAGPDEAGNRGARVIRVTADARTNYRTAVAGSEVVILGKNSTMANISNPGLNSTGNFDIAPSGITARDGRRFTNTADYLTNFRSGNIRNIEDYVATDSESHSIGALRFGTDGSLFVSIGDGTSYNRMDERTLRVQDIANLSGKVLRINPITGGGYNDNPFWNGNADSNESKVWAYGFRNPFRMTIDKQTNTPYVGDVGWTSWEEINKVEKGKNYGWPYFEGGYQNGQPLNLRTKDYANLPEAQNFYINGTAIAPTYAYPHAGGGPSAILMGDFYTGTAFPSTYENTLFYGDVSRNTIDNLIINSDGTVTQRTFASNVPFPVSLRVGPDGNLYYSGLYNGEIGRLRFA